MFWKRERKKVHEEFAMSQQLLKVDLQDLINAMLCQYKNKYVVIADQSSRKRLQCSCGKLQWRYRC